MKIAFCFLTYNNIIRNDIWDKFFENVDKNKYIVFIHPKKQFPSKYNIVKNIIPTKSKTHISVVRATIQLLRETYESDKEITHFIFITQSCIPLYKFDDIYNFITTFKQSIISSINNHHRERYLNLSTTIKNLISENNFVKQHANMMLIRDDVEFLIKIDFTHHFEKILCPDEHYFINILKYLYKRNIINKQINFCNFDMNRTQAVEFNNINIKLINKLREYGFLFMRKVTKQSIIQQEYLLIFF